MTEQKATEAQLRLSTSTGADHDAIVRAIQALEAALASPAVGREEAWTQRIARELAPVVTAVKDHCQEAEAPGGLVRELEVALGRPRVLRTVSDEHARLAAEASDFLASLSTNPDVAVIRARAADLTAELRAHQAHESDLIYEAFMRDIGVGD